jgi:hypothetical protein
LLIEIKPLSNGGSQVIDLTIGTEGEFTGMDRYTVPFSTEIHLNDVGSGKLKIQYIHARNAVGVSLVNFGYCSGMWIGDGFSFLAQTMICKKYFLVYLQFWPGRKVL